MKSEIEIEYEQWLSRLDFLLRQPQERGGVLWYAYNVKPDEWGYEEFNQIATSVGVSITPYTVFVFPFQGRVASVCPDFRKDTNGDTWIKVP